MLKGDIVIVSFPFTNHQESKLRPALVLINQDLDVTLSFITSKLTWREETDIDLMPSSLNGIKKTSLVRLSKIATIDKVLVKGKIGKLDKSTLLDLNSKLKMLLQLN